MSDRLTVQFQALETPDLSSSRRSVKRRGADVHPVIPGIVPGDADPRVLRDLSVVPPVPVVEQTIFKSHRSLRLTVEIGHRSTQGVQLPQGFGQFDRPKIIVLELRA